MARKTVSASEGIENIPLKPKAKAKQTAAAVAVKKKVVNRVATRKPRKVSQIFYEFRYCNRIYSGFYTYKEFMENCVKCLRHEFSFLPKHMLTERAKKIWEQKTSEEGAQVIEKQPAKRAAKAQPTTETAANRPKKRNLKPIDLYEEPDNFYNWADDDAGPTSAPAASTEPPQRLEKVQTLQMPFTTPAPPKLNFFLNDLDPQPAEIGSLSVIQKYRTMLGNEFIPLDSSSPQVPMRKGVSQDVKSRQPNKPPLSTMIEFISG